MRIKCDGDLKIQNNQDYQTDNVITALFDNPNYSVVSALVVFFLTDSYYAA